MASWRRFAPLLAWQHLFHHADLPTARTGPPGCLLSTECCFRFQSGFLISPPLLLLLTAGFRRPQELTAVADVPSPAPIQPAPHLIQEVVSPGREATARRLLPSGDKHHHHHHQQQHEENKSADEAAAGAAAPTVPLRGGLVPAGGPAGSGMEPPPRPRTRTAAAGGGGRTDGRARAAGGESVVVVASEGGLGDGGDGW